MLYRGTKFSGSREWILKRAGIYLKDRGVKKDKEYISFSKLARRGFGKREDNVEDL